MSVEIYEGDALTVVSLLPTESVHCVVTSPPYWGLRDYGTGRWVGGDVDCDHRSPTMREGRNEDRQKLAGSAATNSYQNILAHNARCGKCGAEKIDQQIGLERSVDEHVAALVTLFREVRRVLRKDGTFWLNYGDAYATTPNGRSAAGTKALGNDDRTFRDKPMSTIGGVLKPKDRMLLPARVAIALQEDGWWVRDEIIWHKPAPMPSSVKDRTTPAHEMIYLLTKSERYFFDHEAIKEPAVSTHPSGNGYKRKEQLARGGRGQEEGWSNIGGMRSRRSVWTVNTKPFAEAHFATFPPDLIKPCILAGCPVGGTVLDPFMGAGTTAFVARDLGRNAIGAELNPAYIEIANRRLGLSVLAADTENCFS
jgi:DNA modification methylase